MMMKKLLVLMLVLAMSSAANALIDLTISVTLDPYGTPIYIEDPMDTEIYVAQSETIWLDIHGTVTADNPINVWMIAVGPGSMSGGVVLAGDGTVTDYHPDDEIDVGYTWADFFSDVGYPGVSPMINFIGFYDSTSPFTDMIGVLFDEKEFHCETEQGDVTIYLLNADSGQYEVFDTLVIHQIPEPMTVALLGLGGLFLLRRRR
jgi:hypothetical protein